MRGRINWNSDDETVVSNPFFKKGRDASPIMGKVGARSLIESSVCESYFRAVSKESMAPSAPEAFHDEFYASC